MSKKFTFSKIMKSIDYFSQPFSFKINNQYTIKSFLGGALTLNLIGILLFFAYSFGNDIFFKNKPNVITQINALTYSPYVNFTPNNSIFAIRLEDSNGFPIKNFTKYVNISISYDRNTAINGGYQTVTTYLNINRCDKNLKLASLFNKNFIDEYYCISNYNINIGGYWGNGQSVNTLNIQVFACQNSTENNNSCGIIRSDMNYYFNLYISDGNVNIQNTENPIEYKITDIYTLLDPNFCKISSLKYSNIEVDTDSGFLLKSIHNSTSFFLDSINTDFTSKNQNPLAEYFVYLTNKKLLISRNYIKIQDIAAQLGGITQILIIIFSLLIRPFQRKKVNLKLMNQLFRYSKNEAIVKKEFLSDINQKVDQMKITRKRVLNMEQLNTESGKIIESNEARAVLFREKFKEEQINSILDKIQNSKRFQLSKCDMLISVYFCKFFHSKKIIAKDILIDKSSTHLNKLLNVNSLFEKIMEFDILKFLLFNKEQMMVFNFLEKPEIYIEDAQISSNFSKMIEKLKEINKESANEVIHYFLKFSKKDLKNPDLIDTKLFELVRKDLRNLIFSLK